MNERAEISADTYSSIAGMSRSQLYDLMSQMKMLFDQNEQQARQILVDNPQLTKALFQAQIMLGMVKPRSLVASSESPSEQTEHQPKVQTTQCLPVKAGVQGQVSSSQFAAPTRQQNEPQPSISLPSSPSPPLSFPAQTMSDSLRVPQQFKTFMNAPVSSVSAPHSSQIHSLPLPPLPAPQHFPILASHMPIGSNQGQPPLHTPGMFNPHLPPPHLLQQWRPPSMQPFSHQMHQQMPHNIGFQPSNAPHPHLPQPIFHSGGNHSSPFPHGNPQMPSQLPPQQFYQGGSHIGLDYGNQAGSSMQAERGAHATGGPHLPGPPPMALGQMIPGSTSGQRPPPLTSDKEKALLQQVMSLTPEQINGLPPEQRQQVIQLQEMLR